MKKSYQVIAGLLILLIALLPLIAFMIISYTSELPTRFEETRPLMDTVVTVVVYTDEGIAEEAISAAFTRMEEIERIATIWDSEGEAFKLNRDGYLDVPSDELSELIKLSLYYSELTEGSFDITVQPLLDLWAGGLWRERKEVQQSKINETLRLIGSDMIGIDGNRIYFKTEGMKITLGGIAKGYAVDEALRVLQGMGIKHALVNAGGDIGTIGSRQDGGLWTVALVNPDDITQSLATFRFSGKAIATSGNYVRYFDPEARVHHIIDPHTGFSAPGTISVTIIAESTTQADALSTAVFVMGPEDGMRLVESLDDVEGFIVAADKVIHHSSGLPEYLSERE